MTLATFSWKPDTEMVSVKDTSLRVADEAQASAELAAALEIDIPVSDTTSSQSSSQERKHDPSPTGVPPPKTAKPKSMGRGQKGCGRGTWLKPVTEAIPMHPLSKGDLHLTGINEKKHIKSGTLFRKSVYIGALCSYTTEQHAQAATHVRGMHLATCIACHLCSYRTYQSVNFHGHLEKKHVGKEAEWYAPLPDLSAISIKKEIKEEDSFSDCEILGVKAVSSAETIVLDTESDSDY